MKVMNNLSTYIIEKLKLSKDTQSDEKDILSEDEFFEYIMYLCHENKFLATMDQVESVISVNEDTYPYMLLKYYDNKFFSIVENDYVGLYGMITIITGRNNCYIRTPYRGKKLNIAPGGQLRANKYNINIIFEIFKNVVKNGKVSK